MSLYRALLCTGVLAFAAACTVANPLYNPSGSGGDLGLRPDGSSDLSSPGAVDLSGMRPADLAQATGSCAPGDRGCNGSGTSSLACVGGKLSPERTCPNNSICSGGYCQPPPLANSGVGKNCDLTGDASELLCIGGGSNSPPTCTPFVNPDPAAPTPILWRCARAIGSGVPGTACTAGTQCRSGFCGSNGTCFRACASANECPMNGMTPLKCDAVKILVEGQDVSAMSCIPG